MAATDFLIHNPVYGIVICVDCGYMVAPGELRSHLQKQHHIPPSQQYLYHKKVSQWGVASTMPELASQIPFPTEPVDAIEGLRVYKDGKQCKQCGYVCRNRHFMQQHCKETHKWINPMQRGKGQKSYRKAGIEIKDPWENVWCQRFCSHSDGQLQRYFVVYNSNINTNKSTTHDTRLSTWQQIHQNITARRDAVIAKEQKTIEEGSSKEPNQWLKRAGWAQYLGKCDRRQLLHCIQSPQQTNTRQIISDQPTANNINTDPVAYEIWHGMQSLLLHCQQTVIQRAGLSVRMEAVRSEKHQTRYEPLQGYMEEKTLQQLGLWWGQILMFFYFTQQEHDWRSPKYKFTAQQEAAWRELVEAARAAAAVTEAADADDRHSEDPRSISHCSLDALEQTCLHFCIALLDQRVRRHETECALIGALAVLGIKNEQGEWHDPSSYPRILSAMIKTSRFFVIQAGIEQERDDKEEETPSCLEYVTAKMDAFMVRGTQGPMQWMLDLRTYGLTIWYSTTVQGRISWTGDEISMVGITFNMQEFRSLVHGLQQQALDILQRELLFVTATELPPIPWSKLRDDPPNKLPGWSFLQDPRNPMAATPNWLLDRVADSAVLQRRFWDLSRVQQGGRSAYRLPQVAIYRTAVHRFREKLLMLIQLTWGQPARGPEILSVRYKNTSNGAHRNIFIEQGLVVIVVTYHKGYHSSGKVKVIQRYLPPPVGNLLIWYLWLVLPFVQGLELDAYQQEQLSPFLWPADDIEGREWTTQHIRKVFERESLAAIGQKINVAQYRQLAIGISRRQLSRQAAFPSEMTDEDHEEAAAEEDSIFDLQATHSSYTAESVYARGVAEMDNVFASQRERFRWASEEWHRFLGFPRPTQPVYRHNPLKRPAAFVEERLEYQIQRMQHLRSLHLPTVLAQLYGPGSEFRGQQTAALKAIMWGHSPVLVIMPTGGGKSLLFMLPAFAGKSGMTIVVVPLLALRQDVQDRCRQLGIRCVAWDSEHPPDMAQIVLVTPESALTASFLTFVTRVQALQQLDRIVIDECHLVLNDRDDFRRSLQQQSRLMELGVQMVLLTATLPPTLMPRFCQRMHWTVEQLEVFRSRTSRPNIRYAVWALPDAEDTLAQRVQLIEQYRQEYSSKKLLVFAPSIRNVQALAAALECPAYYSQVAAAQKGQILQQFRAGQVPLVVATSAFSLGVDIPDIHTVMHLGMPYSSLDYMQESGRAGRNGEESHAILIPPRSHEMPDSVDPLLEQMIDPDKQECRRILFSDYFDGIARGPCEAGEIGCDRCEAFPAMMQLEDAAAALPTPPLTSRSPRPMLGESIESIDSDFQDSGVVMPSSPPPSWTRLTGMSSSPSMAIASSSPQPEIMISRTRMIDQQQRQRQWIARQGRQQRQREACELAAYQAWLDQRQGQCLGCSRLQGAGSDHLLYWCRAEESRELRTEYQRWKQYFRSGYRLAAYSGCTCCFVPQAWCQRWEQAADQKGLYQARAGVQRCQYADLILSGLVVGLTVKEGRQALEDWLEGYGISFDDEAGLLEFLRQKVQWGGLECNRLFQAVFVVQLLGDGRM